MATPAAIPAIGATHGREFITHEMFASRPTMATAAKNANLVYKIALLQLVTFMIRCKYTLLYRTALFIAISGMYLESLCKTRTMKYILLLAVFPALLANQCSSNKNKTADDTMTKDKPVQDSVPSCIRQILNDNGKNIPSDLPIRIDQYTWISRTVYLFTADCCDQFNTVYDDSCKAICAPSGGFTGKGDGKCPDFEKEAKFVKMVWEKAKK
jgi:hypothetical protein